MTIEFKELTFGEDYTHKTKGRCTFIAFHPHDGAALVMEEADREDGDICHFFICERHALTLLKKTPDQAKVARDFEAA